MIGMSHIPRCYGNHSETSITPFFKSDLVHVWYGGFLGQQALAAYLVAMVT